jgi:hypothetical protein
MRDLCISVLRVGTSRMCVSHVVDVKRLDKVRLAKTTAVADFDYKIYESNQPRLPSSSAPRHDLPAQIRPDSDDPAQIWPDRDDPA